MIPNVTHIDDALNICRKIFRDEKLVTFTATDVPEIYRQRILDRTSERAPFPQVRFGTDSCKR